MHEHERIYLPSFGGGSGSDLGARGISAAVAGGVIGVVEVVGEAVAGESGVHGGGDGGERERLMRTRKWRERGL